MNEAMTNEARSRIIIESPVHGPVVLAALDAEKIRADTWKLTAADIQERVAGAERERDQYKAKLASLWLRLGGMAGELDAFLNVQPAKAPGNENSCPYGGHSDKPGAECPYCHWITPAPAAKKEEPQP